MTAMSNGGVERARDQSRLSAFRAHNSAFTLSLIMVALPPFMSTSYQFRVMALVWISALAAIGLNILMGFAGQVSLGHAGFFGIGAYSVAIGPLHFGLHPLGAMVIGVLIAAFTAYVVGRPILRLQGHYLAIATLGFGILVSIVATTERHLTGGPDGMQVRTLEIFDWSATGSANWYWISAAVLLIGVVLAQNLRSSRSGLALRGLKESESAASAAGVDIAHYKLLAFIVAAIYAAVAGSMLALMNAFVSPDQASFLHSVELLTMVVIGGLGSVVGSVVGAALLVILPQVLSVFQDYEHVVLGLIIILSITFLPSGIVPSLIARFEASKHR